MAVPVLYILDGNIHWFHESIYHRKEMTYVPTVYIFGWQFILAKQKKRSFMTDLGSCLTLSPVKVIWHFQQRTINHFIK